MGGLILILPVVAFNVWLFCTTGQRQLAIWREQKNWRHLGLAAVVGVLLAIWLSFYVEYSSGEKLRVQGFPIPVVFFHFDDKHLATVTSAPLRLLGTIANLLTGLVAPFIPYKVAEFLMVVKAELK